MEKPFEKIWIDLREFGWGIREVPVVWPDDRETLGPSTVGTEELKDGAVEMQDLHEDVVDKLNKPVDQQQLEAAVNAAVPDAVREATADKLDVVTEEQFNEVFGDGGDSSGSSSAE